MEFGGHPLHVGLWTTTIPRSKWQWNSDYDNGLQIHGATSCVQRMQRVSRVLNKYKLVNKFSLVQTKLGSIHWSRFSLLLGVLHTMLSMCRIFLDPLSFMSLSCHAFYKELKKLLSTNLLWPTLLLHKLPGGVDYFMTRAKMVLTNFCPNNKLPKPVTEQVLLISYWNSNSKLTS